MAIERIPVAPDVLVWARRSVGLTTDAAAPKIGVRPPALEGWEQGQGSPTIKQLRKLAAAYKRPLAVLLLPTPPEDFDALRDFRRIVTDEPARAWTPQLHAEYRRALSQREVILELAEFAPDALRAQSVGFQLPADTSAEDAGPFLRSLLHLDAFPHGTWANPPTALNRAVDAVEQLGVLVIQTHGIDFREMRGFSVSEWPYPVLALNGGDLPRPRLFTLLHELCHIALNAGGLCDLHDQRARGRNDDRVEHYCNEAAASALIPRAALLAMPFVSRVNPDHRWSLVELAELSRTFGASSEAMLLRLISIGKATWDVYREVKPELEAEYEAARERAREQQREAGGGPSYYVIKARDLGHGYVASVLDAFRARAITTLDVADYLEVRYDQLPKLEAVLR
jgi:Zn-dependent peptidase ImmA (M78 family)/transcriptional regulator with XRE-family HTH domain